MEQYIKKSALVAEIEKLKGKISDGSSYCNGWQHALRMLELSLDTLEVKEVNVDFEQELYKAFGQVKDFTLGIAIAKRFYDMGRKHNEPVSEELKEAVDSYTRKVLERTNCLIGNQPVGEEISKAVKFGAKWQKENLWKPADGNDLPILDREVIALLDNGKVVFAHRPPEFWDGKNIITDKVTRHYPKTYNKGGWNIPNIKYWLDVKLPKEIEL